MSRKADVFDVCEFERQTQENWKFYERERRRERWRNFWRVWLPVVLTWILCGAAVFWIFTWK